MNVRPLTEDESKAFVSKLHLALGNTNLVQIVLRTIAESGVGVFVVQDDGL